MLTHADFDDHTEYHQKAITLPEKVERIQVDYDGGRLSITVNGKTIYHAVSGTRDCRITIT